MPMRPRITRAQKPIVCFLLACAPGLAADLFEKSEVMIPMRDGVKLHTVILTPKDRNGPLPILFQRTPMAFPPPSELARKAAVSFA